MSARPPKVAPAVQDAATELGVTPLALQVFMFVRGLEKVSPDLYQSVTEELKAKSQSLRLDELGKIALTIDWLSEHAITLNKLETNLTGRLDEIRSLVGKDQHSEALEALSKKLEEVEQKVGKGGNDESAKTAMQVAGNLQSLVESQGREIDQLRAELAEARREAAEAAKNLSKFQDALRSALGGDGGQGPGKAKPRAEKTVEAVGSGNTAPAPASPESHPENIRVSAALRFGIQREIDYNYLLERMGYRRLSSYTPEELASGAPVPVPGDTEIKQFLVTYETGGSPEEIEIVSVQRGDYQMVQFQRVERQGGLRGWMPRQRKT